MPLAPLAAGATMDIDRGPPSPWRTWCELAAGATAVYLVSTAVVDIFQRMTGGTVAVEELVRQAQVALSVTWMTIGAGALVVGLVRRLPMLRHAGFGLLGLATAAGRRHTGGGGWGRRGSAAACIIPPRCDAPARS